MSVVVVSNAASNFPQTGAGRTLSDMLTDIAIAAGGENDPDRRTRALTALRRAIRVYNEVRWKFNRVSEDYTLVAATSSYALPADFADPQRLVMLDSSNGLVGVGPLIYVDWTDWLDGDGSDTGEGNPPSFYTINNEHEAGTLFIKPKPKSDVATSAYPKMRLYYYRRIVMPTGDSEKINIPVEIEGGVEDLAVAYYVGYIEGAPASVQPVAMALRHKEELEQRYRKYPDK